MSDLPPSIPFSEAAPLLRGDVRYLRLLQKIPPELRGLFGLVVENGHLAGLELLPNNATRAMNTLLLRAGKAPNPNAEHSPKQTTRWVGREFADILDSADYLNPDAMSGRVVHYAGDLARTAQDAVIEDTRARSMEHLYTTSLSQLLRHNGELSRTEQALLQRFAGLIPENLRGAFVCDVARGFDRGFTVTAIGLDPNILSNRVTLELLPAILAPANDRLRQPSMRAGIHAHQRAFMLSREEYETIAASAPKPGRVRL